MSSGKSVVVEQARKRFYVAPKLTSHGAVTDLTQAASMGTQETFLTGCTSMTNSAPSSFLCMLSDVRTKQNIRHVGTYCEGVGLFLYEYKPEFKATGGAGTFLGVMAQDLLRDYTEAVVILDNGYYGVDYSRLRKLRH